MANTIQTMFAIDVALTGGAAKDLAAMTSSMAKLADAGERVNQRLGKVNGYLAAESSLESMSQKVQSLRNRMPALSSQLSASRDRTQSLSIQYEAAKKRLADWSGQLPKNSTQLLAAKKLVQDLSLEYRNSSKETQSLERDYEKLYQAISQGDSKLQAQRKEFEAMGQAMKAAGIDTANLTQEQSKLQRIQDNLKTSQARLQDIKSQLSWDNVRGDILKSAGTIMALREPISTHMNIEQGLANVKAVLNPTTEEFAALSDQAKELGRTTQFSTLQAANTQEALARAGLKTNQVLAVMPSVLSMAAADGMDLALAGSILTDTLGGMGVDMDKLTSQEAKRYADVLANSSASSNTDIATIGSALKVAAPIAGSQNITIEQLGAYIGAFANKGIKGAEAGQAVVGMLNRLVLKDQQAKLNQMGISVKTREGSLRELPDVMKELNTYFSRRNIGEADQLNILNDLFGKNYGKYAMGFMAASSSGAVEAIQLSNQLDAKSGRGKSAEMAAVRNDTLLGDITSLGSAWEGFMNQVGEPLTLWSREIVQAVTKALNMITSFMSKHEALAGTVLKVGAALASWSIIKTVWHYGSLLVQLPFAKIAAIFASNSAAIATGGKVSLIASAQMKLVAAAQWLINTALSANPIALVIGAIAGLVGAYYGIYKHWDKIKAYLQGFLDWFNNLSLADIFASLVSFAQSAWNSISELWSNLAGFFASINLPDIWSPILEGFKSMLDYLYAGWEKFKSFFSINLNPFSTSGSSKLSNTNNQALQSAFGAPSFEVHATGGIMTRPHLGLVAEAGPEAIIPLTDKARGVPLVLQAANQLGMLQNSQSISPLSTPDINLNATQSPASFSSRSLISPTINISITSDNQDSLNLAEKISQAVQEAFAEILSREERLSFA